jgi:hypothetical protein
MAREVVERREESQRLLLGAQSALAASQLSLYAVQRACLPLGASSERQSGPCFVPQRPLCHSTASTLGQQGAVQHQCARSIAQLGACAPLLAGLHACTFEQPQAEQEAQPHSCASTTAPAGPRRHQAPQQESPLSAVLGNTMVAGGRAPELRCTCLASMKNLGQLASQPAGSLLLLLLSLSAVRPDSSLHPLLLSLLLVSVRSAACPSRPPARSLASPSLASLHLRLSLPCPGPCVRSYSPNTSSGAAAAARRRGRGAGRRGRMRRRTCGRACARRARARRGVRGERVRCLACGR